MSFAVKKRKTHATRRKTRLRHERSGLGLEGSAGIIKRTTLYAHEGAYALGKQEATGRRAAATFSLKSEHEDDDSDDDESDIEDEVEQDVPRASSSREAAARAPGGGSEAAEVEHRLLVVRDGEQRKAAAVSFLKAFRGQETARRKAGALVVATDTKAVKAFAALLRAAFKKGTAVLHEKSKEVDVTQAAQDIRQGKVHTVVATPPAASLLFASSSRLGIATSFNLLVHLEFPPSLEQYQLHLSFLQPHNGSQHQSQQQSLSDQERANMVSVLFCSNAKSSSLELKGTQDILSYLSANGCDGIEAHQQALSK